MDNVKIIDNQVYIETSYPNAIEYRFIGTKNVLIQNNITNKSIRSKDGGQAALFGNRLSDYF